MYFVYEMPIGGDTAKHIVWRTNDAIFMFRYGDDPGLDRQFDTWLAEGNEPGVWPPEEVSE